MFKAKIISIEISQYLKKKLLICLRYYFNIFSDH